ncbi:MAG: Ppx/GppA phosphatase family protein [Rhodospirillaceae bacterium]
MARSNTSRRNRQTKPANQGEHCQDSTQDKNRPDSILAAIDLGTNNCRMLIAHPKEQDFLVIDSFSRITRLGEGLSGSGCLSQAAMDRAINALQHCAQKMNHCGVTDSRHVATEACRRANNCDDFVERVSKEVGIKLEIISSDEEAGLALKGCKSLLNLDVPYAIIFDIGGGSTEVLFVKINDPHDMTILGCISMPLGVVTVAEDCGGGDLCERTYEEVAVRVARMLYPFEQAHGISSRIKAGEAQMLGTSGTVTTLGGLHLGLKRYDRMVVDGITLDFETLSSHSHALCKMSMQERAAEPCIGWQRADLVLGGCAILEAICRLWPVGQLRVADRGLREGMLIDILQTQALQTPTQAVLS